MRQCIFASCKSRPDDRIGNVALVHRFPREEHIRKLWVEWIRNKCNLPTFEYNYKAGLCYRHFDRHCYHRSNGLLKPFSYPTFTPADLDSISIIGSSANEIFMNGAPKNNLIIKLDPTLVKNSTSQKSDPGKKFILLVTDQGIKASQAPKINLSPICQELPGSGLVRPQDIPPLRFINKDRAATALSLSNQDKPTPVTKNTLCLPEPQLSGGVMCFPPSPYDLTIQERSCVAQEAFPNECAEEERSFSPSIADCQPDRKSPSGARSSRTSNVLQTVLDSSRRRIAIYRRRLQQEKKKMSRLEKLLGEMKEKQLISCAVAEKIEAILHDD